MSRFSGVPGPAFRRNRLLAAAVLVLAVLSLAVVLLGGGEARAQKSQSGFKDKLRWGTEYGGVAITCSDNGKYVYVAGPSGGLVSDNYGRTGSWQLVLKGKN